MNDQDTSYSEEAVKSFEQEDMEYSAPPSSLPSPSQIQTSDSPCHQREQAVDYASSAGSLTP